MRDIKFRAFNKRDKTMGEPFTLKDAIGSRKVNGVDTSEVEYMQYTGLKDKNGAEIYEGDILRSTETDQVYALIQPLFPIDRVMIGYAERVGFYSNGEFKRYHDDQGGNDWVSWPEVYEVIGNIYQDSNLLKEEHDTGR